MKIKSGIFIVIIFFVSALVVAKVGGRTIADSDAVNSYALDLEIKNFDQVLAHPKLIVAPSHPAQITIANGDDEKYRFQVTAAPAEITGDGQKSVHLRAVILERINAHWVVLAEPTFILIDGVPANLSLEDEKRFSLRVVATSRFHPDAVNFQVTPCPDSMSSVADTLSSSQSSIVKSTDCCSEKCIDGSGQVMRCCGAVQCCVCGVCCSPP
jgi:hypothetical protein